MYVRAVFDNLTFPGTDAQVRSRYESMLEENGPEELYQLLVSKAPDVAQHIASANTRRVVRALEVIELSGNFNPQLPDAEPVIDALKIGLNVERSILAQRISHRVAAMVKAGWQEETEVLVKRGLLETRTACKAIGYREIAAVNAGALALDSALEQIAAITLKFSKRQMQWFNRDADVTWFAADVPGLAQQVLRDF